MSEERGLAVTGVVLAGGQGRRLGRDKIWERVGGENLLGRVVACLSTLSRDILIVLDRERPLPPLPVPVTIAVDLFPGRGSLGGLYTGVRLASEFYSLTVACDMPFLNPSLLRRLVELSPGNDIVVPRLAGQPEPLHALYAKSALPAIESLLKSGGNRIIDFFPVVRVRYIDEVEIDLLDPEHLSFFNINTPADVEKAEELAKRREGQSPP